MPTVKILKILKSKMADGRCFEKLRNCIISTMVRPIGAKFGVMSYIDTLKLSTVKIFVFFLIFLIFNFKIQDGGWPHFGKNQKSPYRQFIATSVLSESCFVLLIDLMNALRQVMW